jgi:hypothetical protein
MSYSNIAQVIELSKNLLTTLEHEYDSIEDEIRAGAADERLDILEDAKDAIDAAINSIEYLLICLRDL